MRGKVRAGVSSCIGGYRNNNEDNYLLLNKYLPMDHKNKSDSLRGELDRPYLFAVCDGMGGGSYGELASFTAVKKLNEIFEESINNNPYEYLIDVIETIILRINQDVSSLFEPNEVVSGSTIVLLYFDQSQLIISNVGDSRGYQLYNGELIRISKDHNHAFFMYELGLISNDELKHHRARHKLTQYLGINPQEMIIDPYINRVEHREGKVTYLLCSDGLVEALEDDYIKFILEQEISTKKKAKQLVKDAIENGSKDNVTALVIELTT